MFLPSLSSLIYSRYSISQDPNNIQKSDHFLSIGYETALHFVVVLALVLQRLSSAIQCVNPLDKY